MKKLVMGMMLITSMSSFAAGIQCGLPEWGRMYTMKQIEQADGSVVKTIDDKEYPEFLNAAEGTTLDCTYEVINSDGIAKVHTCVTKALEDGLVVTETLTVSTDGNIGSQITIDLSEGLAKGTIPEIDPETGLKTDPVVTIDAIEEGAYQDCRLIE